MEKYFRKSPRADKTISKLVLWDSSKSLLVNSIALRLDSANTRWFAIRYGLSFLKLKSSGGTRHLRSEAYKLLYDRGYTYENIGKAFKRTRQGIQQAIQRRTD